MASTALIGGKFALTSDAQPLVMGVVNMTSAELFDTVCPINAKSERCSSTPSRAGHARAGCMVLGAPPVQCQTIAHVAAHVPNLLHPAPPPPPAACDFYTQLRKYSVPGTFCYSKVCQGVFAYPNG